jgi:hypothetical protein
VTTTLTHVTTIVTWPVKNSTQPQSSAIDQGIINRCHLIEMNQATNLSAYLPLASTILGNMGIAATAVPTAALTGHAKSARDFITGVDIEGIQQGGSLRY